MPGCFWIPCALHCLHNSVRAGMDAIDSEFEVFEKVKNFVRMIATSPKQAGIFRKCQIQVLETMRKEKANAVLEAQKNDEAVIEDYNDDECVEEEEDAT